MRFSSSKSHRGETKAPHNGYPERSEAESKDPADELNVNATAFLDFARNDGAFERLSLDILGLRISLDVVSLELGIHEIFLAGETGAVFLFVV